MILARKETRDRKYSSFLHQEVHTNYLFHKLGYLKNHDSNAAKHSVDCEVI